MKSYFYSILIISITLLFNSCEKIPGEGGTSKIKGKVYVKDYNAEFTYLESEYYAHEEDVYIIYGDNEIYDDKFETHYDGSFQFEYLNIGKYTIFLYSKDSTGNAPSGMNVIKREIEITERNQIIELEDIVILK